MSIGFVVHIGSLQFIVLLLVVPILHFRLLSSCLMHMLVLIVLMLMEISMLI
jgi:hypothetical protein